MSREENLALAGDPVETAFRALSCLCDCGRQRAIDKFNRVFASATPPIKIVKGPA